MKIDDISTRVKFYRIRVLKNVNLLPSCFHSFKGDFNWLNWIKVKSIICNFCHFSAIKGQIRSFLFFMYLNIICMHLYALCLSCAIQINLPRVKLPRSTQRSTCSSIQINPRSACADQADWPHLDWGLTLLTCSVGCLWWLARCPAGRSPAGWRRGLCTGRLPASAASRPGRPSHRGRPGAGSAARPAGAGSPAEDTTRCVFTSSQQPRRNKGFECQSKKRIND